MDTPFSYLGVVRKQPMHFNLSISEQLPINNCFKIFLNDLHTIQFAQPCQVSCDAISDSVEFPCAVV